MTTLYLIRHGETIWNADRRFQGHRDISLNETGHAQAEIVARALASHQLDAIITSDLARAYETADIVAAHHPPLSPERDIRLREAFFGDWEGLTMPEIDARWPKTAAAWRQDSLHTRPQGGETLEHVQIRVGEALDDIVRRYPHGSVAVVAHGGSLRAIVAIALGADLSIFRRLRLDNCSISVVRVRDGHHTLMQLNDICHLGDRSPRTSWDEAGDQWRVAQQAPQTKN